MTLLKKILRSKFALNIRNLTGIKPIGINLDNLQENYSISDGFLWRTDNGFKTTFNFSDLIKIFFYDKQNNFLKKISKVDLNYSNSISIDDKFLNNIKDYGIFYIFHKIDKKLESSIRNACYTGYSYKNQLESYVHGNFPISYSLFDSVKIPNCSDDIISSSLFNNRKYKLQKYFKNFSKSEIFIQNPLSTKIKFNVNNVEFKLDAKCGKIIDISNYSEVEIVSNCYFFRPIVFSYKNNFIDVHHG